MTIRRLNRERGGDRFASRDARYEGDRQQDADDSEHAAMATAERENHDKGPGLRRLSFWPPHERWAVHSSGGSCTPVAQRRTRIGHKAMAPGIINRRKPQEP